MTLYILHFLRETLVFVRIKAKANFNFCTHIVFFMYFLKSNSMRDDIITLKMRLP